MLLNTHVQSCNTYKLSLKLLWYSLSTVQKTLFDIILKKDFVFCCLGWKEHPPQRTVTVGRNASAKRWLLARKLPALICCTGYLPPLTWSPRPTAGKDTVSALALVVNSYLETVFAIHLAFYWTLCNYVIIVHLQGRTYTAVSRPDCCQAECWALSVQTATHQRRQEPQGGQFRRW